MTLLLIRVVPLKNYPYGCGPEWVGVGVGRVGAGVMLGRVGVGAEGVGGNSFRYSYSSKSLMVAHCLSFYTYSFLF